MRLGTLSKNHEHSFVFIIFVDSFAQLIKKPQKFKELPRYFTEFTTTACNSPPPLFSYAVYLGDVYSRGGFHVIKLTMLPC